MTSAGDDFQPCAACDSASKMPSGISTTSTASENVIWRSKRAVQLLVAHDGSEPFSAHKHAALG